MNKTYIRFFNVISFSLLVLSGIVTVLGRYIRHFSLYNDTNVLIQAFINPSTNPVFIICCFGYTIAGIILGLLVDCFILILSKLNSNKFALNNIKNATSLLGFSVMIFCLCINHIGLELQFVFKNL